MTSSVALCHWSCLCCSCRRPRSVACMPASSSRTEEVSSSRSHTHGHRERGMLRRHLLSDGPVPVHTVMDMMLRGAADNDRRER